MAGATLVSPRSLSIPIRTTLDDSPSTSHCLTRLGRSSNAIAELYKNCHFDNGKIGLACRIRFNGRPPAASTTPDLHTCTWHGAVDICTKTEYCSSPAAKTPLLDPRAKGLVKLQILSQMTVCVFVPALAGRPPAKVYIDSRERVVHGHSTFLLRKHAFNIYAEEVNVQCPMSPLSRHFASCQAVARDTHLSFTCAVILVTRCHHVWCRQSTAAVAVDSCGFCCFQGVASCAVGLEEDVIAR